MRAYSATRFCFTFLIWIGTQICKPNKRKEEEKSSSTFNFSFNCLVMKIANSIKNQRIMQNASIHAGLCVGFFTSSECVNNGNSQRVNRRLWQWFRLEGSRSCAFVSLRIWSFFLLCIEIENHSRNCARKNCFEVFVLGRFGYAFKNVNLAYRPPRSVSFTCKRQKNN